MGKELEPTIWILGEHNEHLPALQFTPESTLSIVSYYFIYCFFRMLIGRIMLTFECGATLSFLNIHV